MNTRWFFRAFLLFLLAFAAPACHKTPPAGGVIAPSAAPPEARRLLSLLQHRNTSARPFKGIGKLSMWGPEGLRTTRAAWAGTPEGLLRVEFMGLPGQPTGKFLFDGKTSAFLSHLDGRLHRQSGADPDLAEVSGLPIRVREVAALLSGAIPIHAHDTVSLSSEASGRGQVLSFRKKWAGVVEKLHLDPTNTFVACVEILKGGHMRYQVRLTDMRVLDGRLIPFEITVTDGGERGMRIAMERCWTDIPVPADVFTLKGMD